MHAIDKPRRPSDASGPARGAASTAARVAAGGANVRVVLSPAAAARLRELAEVHGSARAAIEWALVNAAATPPHPA